jgi:hypothetical protein
MKKESVTQNAYGVVRFIVDDKMCNPASYVEGVDNETAVLSEALYKKGFELQSITVEQLFCSSCRRPL